jgi:glucokinase
MQSTPVRVLSGDIGGTNTRLAVVIVDGNKLRIEREQNFLSRNYTEFGDLLGDFLRNSEIPHRAALGIAGPVRDGAAQMTNLSWRIVASKLKNEFGLESCDLLNDLEAIAWGLPSLGEDDLRTLHPGGPDVGGNRAVIAAGTGLGEAGLYWDGLQYRPFSTEGGHASFSPGDDMEMALLQHLKQVYGHVSWERVVSGPGLVSLHEFHCLYCHIPLPEWLQQEMKQGDAAAAIANAALTKRDELCVKSLDWFVRLYGAEAGNLALKVMSRGGLYLGGGIAPKILPCLQNGAFLESFFSKGRMRPLLEAMPVNVILNDRAALYGPALHAARN